MTLANKITFGRLFLVPVFVTAACVYGASVRAGTPESGFRLTAIILFGLTASSDWLDGYVARKFNQCSRLGSIIDPLADKVLLAAAVFVLTFCGWPDGFPIWFALLLLMRDLLTISGAYFINCFTGKVEIRPNWTGKVATPAIIAAISFVLLGIAPLATASTWIAGATIAVSGLYYSYDGLRRLYDDVRQRYVIEANQ